tara:strand:- start:26178 stop:26903 length:726 start_codon:yes stop_codon:yes gene_type:complete
MGYATQQLVTDILAQALTSATSSVVNGNAVSLNSIGSVTNPNAISSDTINQYITWADEEVDGVLSEMYAVPLCEKADLEMRLIFDVNEYNSDIELTKALNLVPGDVLVFIDASQEERHTVETVVNNTTVELSSTLVGMYDASETRVLRVKYPAPIALISARLAAANIYDKYFSAEVSPNQSEYGKHLRAMARRDFNNILNGRTVLHGQRRIGHRFFNPNLRDRYRLPGADSDGSRDIGETS